MIKVEGYKAFRGTMRINPPRREMYEVAGDWLYKPDTDCWYGNGSSFPAEFCEVITDDT